MAKVVAKERGYDGQSIRDEGDTFDMPAGEKASWFSPADEDDKPKSRGRQKAED